MKRGIVIIWLFLACGAAGAEWVDIGRGLPETDIRSVAARQGRVYAATAKRLYRWDPGSQWTAVKGLRPVGGGIHHVEVIDGRPYVGSDKGLQAFDGQKWHEVYREEPVYAFIADPRGNGLIAGTTSGLVRVGKKRSERIAGMTRPVRSIAADSKGAIWVGTDQGVWKSEDGEHGWTRWDSGGGASAENDTLAQFEIEEIAAGPNHTALIFMPLKNEIFALSGRGQLKGLTQGEIWDVSLGLPDRDVQELSYDPESGDLYLASAKGVFRYPKPEFRAAGAGQAGPDAKEILRSFAHEPSIRQVQEAAIRYAEVRPEKIQAWREAAAAKAWMPTLSLSADTSDDQNIDLDRGGTADPDRFIEGPQEKSRDWHVGLSWDLADLVWNDAQTSIDTRSRLLVELRDDVLTEVTHLYFERRRLQVESLLMPAKELPLQLERQLKLEELTAGIDALTGGYLSKEAARAGS